MNSKSQPQVAGDVVVLPGAHIVGDVSLASGCSVWYNAVLRGDEAPISIGENSNIQDNCTLHTSADAPMRIGRGVTVGHNAVLHGCTIGDNCLIGMGAILLDGAVLGDNCIVGAGALVTQGRQIPSGCLVLGAPAQVKRPLTQQEIDAVKRGAAEYTTLKEQYRT